MVNIITSDTEQPSRDYAYEITGSHFGKAPKKKFCRKAFKDVVEGAHVSGRLDAITTLGEKIKLIVDEKLSPEEALGEMHIMLQAQWNDFNKGAGRGKCFPISDIGFLATDADVMKLVKNR